VGRIIDSFAAYHTMSLLLTSSSFKSGKGLFQNHHSVFVRFATSKAGGSSKNGRDSNPKYLGVKKFGGEFVQAGNIIIRQRGLKYGIVESTRTVEIGRDHTIYALAPGYVKFWWHSMKKKYFVEVLKSNEGEKYPITSIPDWGLSTLLTLPANTPCDEAVIKRLHDYVKSLNANDKHRLFASIPKDSKLIGDVQTLR
jgi:large subunit ribosomal protein L27